MSFNRVCRINGVSVLLLCVWLTSSFIALFDMWSTSCCACRVVSTWRLDELDLTRNFKIDVGEFHTDGSLSGFFSAPRLVRFRPYGTSADKYELFDIVYLFPCEFSFLRRRSLDWIQHHYMRFCEELEFQHDDHTIQTGMPFPLQTVLSPLPM